ncbi:MAG: hypothetical protein A2V76_09385 [Candidatus Aminicenantes bacterium RBG_16_63_14]|nr:MAG: hypothetical protein A2V76_09385 [Candidatus Aminicenantes bacterium RBG_16_63_14]
MSSRARTGLRIVFLLAFAGLTLGINFFHTETSVVGRNDCPACHFLTSSLSTGPGVVFIVPALLCRETLAPVAPLRSNEVIVLSLCSRSPPQA